MALHCEALRLVDEGWLHMPVLLHILLLDSIQLSWNLGLSVDYKHSGRCGGVDFLTYTALRSHFLLFGTLHWNPGLSADCEPTCLHGAVDILTYTELRVLQVSVMTFVLIVPRFFVHGSSLS